MSDPDGGATQTQASSEVSEQLTRSLSSIWEQHTGARPSAVSLELSTDTVRFVMQDAVSTIGNGTHADDAEPGVVRSPDSTRYKNEASAAVRRITRRRVRAFIPKRNQKTDVASDTYVLEPIHHPR